MDIPIKGEKCMKSMKKLNADKKFHWRNFWKSEDEKKKDNSNERNERMNEKWMSVYVHSLHIIHPFVHNVHSDYTYDYFYHESS